MKRGFTKAYRKELYSMIWSMPPIYHRTWFWLRQSVNHSLNLVPTTNGFGIWILQGQRLTSYQRIAEGVKYVENRQTIVPDRKTIQKILRWLEWHKMIELTCHTSGTLITIVNWHTYNSASNAPDTDLGTVNTQGSGQGCGNANGNGKGHGSESGDGCKQEWITLSRMEDKNNIDEIFSDEEGGEYDCPF